MDDCVRIMINLAIYILISMVISHKTSSHRWLAWLEDQNETIRTLSISSVSLSRDITSDSFKLTFDEEQNDDFTNSVDSDWRVLSDEDEPLLDSEAEFIVDLLVIMMSLKNNTELSLSEAY